MIVLFIIGPRHQSLFGVGERLNPKSIIQSLETLLVELTETHLEFIIYLLETFFFFFGEIPFRNLE